MDSSLRKRFMSPFSISTSAEKSMHHLFSPSLQQEQSRRQPLTPGFPSRAKISLSDAKTSLGRSQERSLKSQTQMSENVSESGPRQKVSRSLFNMKPRDMGQSPLLEKGSLAKQQFSREKEHLCKMDSSLLSDSPGTDNEKASISVVELAAPERLSKVSSVDTYSSKIPVEELLGPYHNVEVCHPSHFCELLSPETVEKFKLTVSPAKVQAPHFSSLPCSSINLIIDDTKSRGIGIQATRKSMIDLQYCRLLKEKDKFSQVQSPMEQRSINLQTAKKRTTSAYSDLPKSEELSLQDPSLSESRVYGLSGGSRKTTIRGFSIPRCGRLTNQSYQAQAKEFQEIISSKVRQTAEVVDCLQHKELLYKILQF